MEVSATSRPRIPELPNEVLQNIFDHIRLQEHLKNVRLACKLFAMLVEPCLFRRMVLVPYIDCLEPFARLMRDNPIARHVKSIWYDVKWRYTAGLHPCRSVQQTYAIRDKMSANGLLSLRDEGLEIMLLSECWKVLPSLRRVFIEELLPREIDPDRRMPVIGMIPSYLSRLFRDAGAGDPDLERGASFHPRHEFVPASKALLLSCYSAGTRLSELALCQLDSSTFLRGPGAIGAIKELSMYQTVFGQLKDLSLSFEHSPQSIPSLVERQNFARLVTAASKVQTLSLTGPAKQGVNLPDSQAGHSWLASIVRDGEGKISNKVVFPHLTVLDLSCMPGQEDELIALISNHRNTLKHLTMSDMMLVPASSDGPSPCWIRLFKQIRSYQIDVELEAFFSNSRSQLLRVGWDLSPPASSLKSMMLKWLRGEGSEECPMQRAAVKSDLKGADIEPKEEDFFEGDRTIRMLRVPIYLNDDLSGDDDDDDDDDESDSYGDIMDSEDSWPEEFDERYDDFDEFDQEGYYYYSGFHQDSMLDEMLDSLGAPEY
ncbi:hypothetical protein A1O1_05196 [Capronia coronata CBS 617.96]|uniref:F-box domain-containing protein n=1 Tax=Capronia coronata CBS 617.96 TaxID=1182541 RepID=W9YG73_9EURO|nr:uncharacterized protein A1O1_05196 [Capronia coronata CBS 617.96]EXJ88266.1 hypothetical protein A1O1_05196 [Capronia coronata CBS 617.96]